MDRITYLYIFCLAYRYGEVPKYIQEIKFKKAEQNKLDAAVDRNCPLGHIALTEEERKESIVLAEQSMSFFCWYYIN